MEPWHFWPRKNSASIANREGLRLDFANHNAAILGKAFLAASEQQIETMARVYDGATAELQTRLAASEQQAQTLWVLLDEAQHMVDLSKATCITSQDANYLRAESWLARYDAALNSHKG